MQTSLIMASTNGHLEVVQLLLERKADVCAADEVKKGVGLCLPPTVHRYTRAVLLYMVCGTVLSPSILLALACCNVFKADVLFKFACRTD
jgi:ankyrin repeat protein